MVPMSVAFVFFYMAFHMRTFWLALLGMLMILLSVPMAMAFYLPSVPFFSQVRRRPPTDMDTETRTRTHEPYTPSPI